MSTFWLHQGQDRIPLRQGETTIGRSPYCSVVLNSPTVSRQHAAIMLVGTSLNITDLGSRNGTRRNGLLITGTTVLEVSDVLTIGSCKLEVSCGNAHDDAGDKTQERIVSEYPGSGEPPLRLTLDDRKSPGQPQFEPFEPPLNTEVINPGAHR